MESSPLAVTAHRRAHSRDEETEMIQQLWEKVQEQALQISQRVGAEDHAVGLEICTQTLKEGAIKVHVHLALMRT